MDTWICNVSQGGMALAGPQVDGVGTECEVSLVLPGADGRLDLRGRIIWSDESAETPVMGFCFDELTREQRVALANFLLARFHQP